MARLARRWILVFCQIEAAMKWREALETGGAVYKRTCQWIKPDGKPQYSGDRPGIGYESIVACHAPGRSAWNGRSCCHSGAIRRAAMPATPRGETLDRDERHPAGVEARARVARRLSDNLTR